MAEPLTESLSDKGFEPFDHQDLTPLEEFDRWNPETAEVLNDLMRALRRKKGFGLFFVQCSPAQGQQVMATIRERLPQKRLVELELNRESETLYGDLLERYQQDPFQVACITKVEQVLYSYEDTKRLAGWTSEEIYSYSWKGVPPLLSHLNRQREVFEANLPVALVFLVPNFVIDYFIQRAPDFFDWRSGFFKFTESAEDLQKASQELVGRDYEEYRTLSHDQRIEKILEIKDKILQLDPLDCEQRSSLLREQGRLFESGGDASQALDCYDRAVTVKPDYHWAWHNRGYALTDLQRYEEAIESYDRCLEIQPDYYWDWGGRGYALAKLQRYEEAIESYDRCLEIKPDFHYAWNNRGNALGNLQRYEEAIESYDRCLEIKPDFHYAWNNRGNALRDLQRYEEAIESYDCCLEIKPDFHDAWNNRGAALHYLKCYDQAVESYDCCLEIKPDFHDAWNNRGAALHYLKCYDQAVESYDRVLEIEPDYTPSLRSKGFALYQMGRFQEAAACFIQSTKIQTDDTCAWNNQGYLALVEYSYGLQPIFGKPLLIRQLQDCSGSQAKPEVDQECCQKSLELLDNALKLDPEFTIAWANRSFPAYYLHQYQTALQNCDQALELDRENKEDMNEVIYSNRGCILLQLQNPTAALQAFTTALAIDSQLDEAWIGQGTALYQLGRYAEARDSFTRALQLNHPLAQTNLSLVQQRLEPQREVH